MNGTVWNDSELTNELKIASERTGLELKLKKVDYKQPKNR